MCEYSCADGMANDSRSRRSIPRQAMPLDQFITETMATFATDADEILVESARPRRANVGPKEHGFVDAFNAQMLSAHPEWLTVDQF
jgi:hypothetical protein